MHKISPKSFEDIRMRPKKFLIFRQLFLRRVEVPYKVVSNDKEKCIRNNGGNIHPGHTSSKIITNQMIHCRLLSCQMLSYDSIMGIFFLFDIVSAHSFTKMEKYLS